MRCLHRYRRRPAVKCSNVFTVDAGFGQCENNDAFLSRCCFLLIVGVFNSPAEEL